MMAQAATALSPCVAIAAVTYALPTGVATFVRTAGKATASNGGQSVLMAGMVGFEAMLWTRTTACIAYASIASRAIPDAMAAP